jgi:hypothetical protein
MADWANAFSFYFLLCIEKCEDFPIITRFCEALLLSNRCRSLENKESVKKWRFQRILLWIAVRAPNRNQDITSVKLSQDRERDALQP